LLATSDVRTAYGALMSSLGTPFVAEDGTPQFDTEAAATALDIMLELQPYMDPQVTTFDQPKVQQQLYNGTAAMAIMFSGRMYDLTQPANSKLSDSFAFAAPPKATDDAEYVYNNISVDGWSIPFNTKLDHDMLFQMIASSVSEDASEASIPAAYPAREGMVTEKNSPYGKAANDSLAGAMPPVIALAGAPVTEAIRPILVQVLTGGLSPEDGLVQMQAAAEQAAG